MDQAESAVTNGDVAVTCPTDGEEWEVAKVYIEDNATDEEAEDPNGEPGRSTTSTWILR